MRNNAPGFTLIEVMIAIAVLAVMLSIAAPSFRDLIQRSNLESLQDNFATAVVLARTEAASRALESRVCPLPLPPDGSAVSADPDANDCAGLWGNGWGVVVITESNEFEVIAEFPNRPDYPLQVQKVNPANALSAASDIRFNQLGGNARQERYVMSVCEGPGEEKVRGVVVEISGRAFTINPQDFNNEVKARFHNGANDGGADNVLNTINLDCTP